MKRFTILVLAVTMMLTLCGGVALGGKKYAGETMQVFIGITPNAREQIMEYIAPELKKKWGIDLAVEAIGSTQMIEKVLVMKDNPRVTIAGWDVPIGIKAAGLGLCDEIDPTKIPNLLKLYKWALEEVDGKLKVLSANLTAIGLIYNTKEFEANELVAPSSWEDLWRKDLSGRVSVTALESTWGISTLVTLARINGGGEQQIDAGFNKIITLKPNIHTIHTWSSEMVKLMQLDEIWMATTGSNMGPSLRQNGFPAKWVAPSEGVPMVNGGMSIVKNAPFQDVANDFLNLYYDTDFQLMRVRQSGIISVNKEVWGRLSATEQNEQPVKPDKFDTLMQLDWKVINNERAAWTERWHKEMQ